MQSTLQYHNQPKTKRLIITSILLFVFVYGLNWNSTALREEFTLGWSIVLAFIKSYAAIVLFYFGFAVWEKVVPDMQDDKQQLQSCFFTILLRVQQLFLGVIFIQISINLWSLWQELGLYPLELGIWESIWTLIRYIIGLFGTWVLEFWFWMGKQLRISFLLNNPCIGGICLEEYPWVSLLLTALFMYTLKQLWRLSLVRGTVHFGLRILYSIVRVIGKYVLLRVSKKAAASISSSLLVSVGKQTISALRSLYQIPEKDIPLPLPEENSIS